MEKTGNRKRCKLVMEPKIESHSDLLGFVEIIALLTESISKGNESSEYVSALHMI